MHTVPGTVVTPPFLHCTVLYFSTLLTREIVATTGFVSPRSVDMISEERQYNTMLKVFKRKRGQALKEES